MSTPVVSSGGKPLNVLMIGLGKLGLPLCRRIAAAGHNVNIFSTRGMDRALKSSADIGLGAKPVPSIRSWLQANRSVSSLYMVTCVPTSKEVSQLADIIVGDASMLEAPFKEENRSKFHWIDCTSGFPPLTKAIAEKLRVASAADSVSRRETVFTDCAVSGGPHGAKAGVLTSMVGSQDPSVVDDQESGVRQLISCWSGAPGGHVFGLGPVGSGHAVKSVNNALLAANLLMGSEAMVTLAKAGVDVEAALNAIDTSSGRTFVLQGRFPKNILTRKFDYGFNMAGLQKDVANALQLMEGEGIYNPMSELALKLVNDALSKLGPEADHTEIVKVVEDESKAPGCVKARKED
ncbi:2-hydroxy-3-oxopropionate reductase, putative [Perkinsus marinus ATCC 50983]|uniref:2-hydroxy-3-oxopropionate reductase, putative n=1 Tax=Perkinsus marinus (strain ATCC 50983 / TXsc) TaxID=423536 RepID=C5LF72_PERM5|nr:2-hydroxy-3-oxopropionate reductase, putative [Perkinsus marinus ATCC 50983]EER04587.1 2-hydroxy-3-oxopropionate reductase, putative [Perkinsus marinus ATCC 50983]|eukprot:XP_002772771.1 2-hydroxy-3-oxopropionate reductase, putative [Perkinsus marinus ATCC 50983]